MWSGRFYSPRSFQLLNRVRWVREKGTWLDHPWESGPPAGYNTTGITVQRLENHGQIKSVWFTLILLVHSFPSFPIRLGLQTHTQLSVNTLCSPVAVVTYYSGYHSCPTHSILSHNLGRPPYHCKRKWSKHTTQKYTHTHKRHLFTHGGSYLRVVFCIKFSAMSHVNFSCCPIS